MKNNKVYLITVTGTMFLFPICSICIENCLFLRQDIGMLVGKWFVFWAIGVRLFVAGLKQSFKPSFTLKEIFKIKNKDSEAIVRELGFANICIGLTGLLSLFFGQFMLSAAIAGGLYYGLAGSLHIINKPAGFNEKVAMISDIFIFVLMAIIIASML